MQYDYYTTKGSSELKSEPKKHTVDIQAKRIVASWKLKHALKLTTTEQFDLEMRITRLLLNQAKEVN